jgi:predicted amidohydrolase YtcJ
MSPSAPELVVCGDVIVEADGPRLVRAGALGIAGGRVVAVGDREELRAAAVRGATIHEFGDAAVIPGLHDFHIHLVGLARARAAVRLDDAADVHEVAARLREWAGRLGPGEWLTGRGWSEAQLRAGLEPLREAVGERPAYLSSHDGHSAWASPAALGVAGISAATADPAGGRIERDARGVPTGILRETALERVAGLVPRLQGAALRPHLEATLVELAALGVTGASEAGDYTDENGTGPDAAFGDSYSSLTDLADAVDGRLRLTIGIPADAIPAAAERGHRTGARLSGRRTMRFGWAKEYADGALGSGTAALFEPRTCGDPGDTGIMRVGSEQLDEILSAGRRAGIGLAVHAIGDRAAAVVLDAIERAPSRRPGLPPDRIEHLQLVRPVDRRRLARLGVVASIQPVHAAADRDLVEACWDGRQADAYAWRSMAELGAVLAAGSDAPVESVNPWLGVFAAVHRRLPSDPRPDWRAEEALTPIEALAAFTIGPARAIGAEDEGRLRIGARADLAVLDRSVEAILAADDATAETRSLLTIVDGSVVHQG